MSPTFEIPFGRLGGRSAGIALVVICFVGGIWLFNWGQQCYGPEGELHYQGHDWYGFYTSFGQGYNFGLMWLQEGQRVAVSFQADLPRHGWAYVWFGPAEKWVQRSIGLGFHFSKSRLQIKQGSGARDFVATKSGLHVIYYYYDGNHLPGQFTVSWRVL
jgi:hypothetical protein